MGARISREGQPQGSNTKPQHPHHECESESAEGGHIKPAHSGTFSQILSKHGF